jgi:plastocyanin
MVHRLIQHFLTRPTRATSFSRIRSGTLWSIVALGTLPAFANTVAVKVVSENGAPVPDAVVYAQPISGTNVPAASPKAATMEQVDREFVPHVLAIRVGTKVNFPNRDPLMHHVYSFSKVKNFEIKLYSGELPHAIVFDKPGVVTLGCNIHDWMLGYIFVAETPYFAKTDASGAAALKDLVPGEFELRVWHPDQRTASTAKPLRFDSRNNVDLAFTVEVVPQKRKFKPPLNPTQYR